MTNADTATETTAHEPTDKEKQFKAHWAMRWDWPHAFTEAAIRDKESPWPTFAQWLNRERTSMDLLRQAMNQFTDSTDGIFKARGPKLYALRQSYERLSGGKARHRPAGRCGICQNGGYANVEGGVIPCVCTVGMRKAEAWNMAARRLNRPDLDPAKQRAAIDAALAERKARWGAAGVSDDEPATAEHRAATVAALAGGIAAAFAPAQAPRNEHYMAEA